MPWTQLPMVAAPFADFTWRYARQILAARGGDDTSQAAVARVLAGLLHRARDGPAGPGDRPDQRGGRLQPAPGTARPGRGRRARLAAGEDEADGTGIEPFGVFDPLAQEREPW